MSDRLEESPSDSPRPKQQDNPDNDTRQNEEEQAGYYNEYCRLYLTNQILVTQLRELNIEKADLVIKLAKLEVTSLSSRNAQRNSHRGTARRSTRKSEEFDAQLWI